jgi:Leucine-rich repeat (LRR) protein
MRNVKIQEFDSNDEFNIEDLINIESLILSHNQIEDIEGISRLTSLIELNLTSNSISDVR